MKIKTSEATPNQINYLVAKIEGLQWASWNRGGWANDWAQGGPIIERDNISIEYMAGAGDAGADVWVATRVEGSSISEEQGDTPLVAAMRAYVASQLGKEVEIPEELK